MQRHLFIIDPLEKLNLKLDTSLRIMQELAVQGQKVYIAEAKDLMQMSSNPCASCTSKEIIFTGKNDLKFNLAAPAIELLTFFHGIHMRKDPPFDMNYITTTWLLETALKKNNNNYTTTVFNNPNTLRSFNEKLGILNFPELIKDCLVSSSSDQIVKFAKKNNEDIIIKPLTMHGGKGIIRVQTKKEKDYLQIIKQCTENDTSIRLIQAFNQEIYNGEVRLFAAFSKIFAWCLKKPRQGEFLANTSAGAELEKYKPGLRESIIIRKITKKLLDKGIYFVGFDLIGGYISEINITSPRLLQATSDKNNYYTNIAKQIIKFKKNNF